MPRKEIELMARGVMVRRGRLLVCRTAKSSIVYLPGGHIEFGETVTAALAREIREELGCTSKVGRFLGAVQHTFIQKRRRHWEINLIFEMRVFGLPGNGLPVAVEKHLSFEWVEMDRLKAANLEPAALCDLLSDWLSAQDGRAWVEP